MLGGLYTGWGGHICFGEVRPTGRQGHVYFCGGPIHSRTALSIVGRVLSTRWAGPVYVLDVAI
eukprot:6229420-Pyramimonas_sp.AAC.1